MYGSTGIWNLVQVEKLTSWLKNLELERVNSYFPSVEDSFYRYSSCSPSSYDYLNFIGVNFHIIL